MLRFMTWLSSQHSRRKQALNPSAKHWLLTENCWFIHSPGSHRSTTGEPELLMTPRSCNGNRQNNTDMKHWFHQHRVQIGVWEFLSSEDGTGVGHWEKDYGWGWYSSFLTKYFPLHSQYMDSQGFGPSQGYNLLNAYNVPSFLSMLQTRPLSN